MTADKVRWKTNENEIKTHAMIMVKTMNSLIGNIYYIIAATHKWTLSDNIQG